MKKRYLIIMIAQAFLILFMGLYAFIQKLEADKQIQIKLVVQQEAEAQLRLSRAQRDDANDKINKLQTELDELKRQLKK